MKQKIGIPSKALNFQSSNNPEKKNIKQHNCWSP